MCAQCVAQGAVYVVPGLAALRVWSRHRTRSLQQRTAEPTSATVVELEDARREPSA